MNVIIDSCESNYDTLLYFQYADGTFIDDCDDCGHCGISFRESIRNK